jgi:hypothetical protein
LKTNIVEFHLGDATPGLRNTKLYQMILSLEKMLDKRIALVTLPPYFSVSAEIHAELCAEIWANLA